MNIPTEYDTAMKELFAKALDTPACFRRIDAIVEAFSRHGLSTTRHDF